MSTTLKLPESLTNTTEAHQKWLSILQLAEHTVEEDAELQRLTAKGMHLKERALPPEIVGRTYAKYCEVVNKLYDAYLNSVHLQRAPYINEIITVFIKRMYELRNELVHIIINDYVYVDRALQQLQITPMDIQIVVPYHFPLETRSDNIEQLLQKMWADAYKRKKRKEARAKLAKPKPPPAPQKSALLDLEDTAGPATAEPEPEEDIDVDIESPPASIHTYVPEEFIQSILIQRHERFRDHMVIKRDRIKEAKRDMLLGIIPDPFKSGRSFVEENNKVYEGRRNTRLKIKQTYLEELERENTRLIAFRKGEQMEDITDEIRTWFKEWFYGYNFFPEYPYEIEGGTLMVVRGEYPTIDEKKAEDEKFLNETKGKTKDQLKEERAKAKADAKLKAEAQKQAKKKEAINLFKAKCNPFSDPGYMIKESPALENVIEAIRNYRVSWSLYDELPTDRFGEAVYGYMKPLMTEELMKNIHIDCRRFIDEMMRLDLKMLIQMHQLDFKNMGFKYPKLKPRKKPKKPREPKALVVDEKLLKNAESVFDLGIVTKPTTKLHDIIGDLNYAAYERNIKDPDASFPLPGYGDIRERLTLSCIMGCGMQAGAPRNKAVMLLGPERNGKSFLVDAVAGELNAVKIDISPEGFSAVAARPAKALMQVFQTARAFQPAVVFMKNVERVFATKVPPEDKHLQAPSIKTALPKLVKQIPPDDKVIFIATCSNPWVAKAKPLVSMFDEIILVPRSDYGTLQQFFYQNLQSIKSIPRDYQVQHMAQLMQGFGLGDIIEAYHEVMTPERIVRLNVEPLSPGEILEELMRKDLEPLTLEEYQKYVDFYIENSPIKQEREDYARINALREEMYKKMAKKMKAAEKAAEKAAAEAEKQ